MEVKVAVVEIRIVVTLPVGDQYFAGVQLSLCVLEKSPRLTRQTTKLHSA